jgi:hypothetical protein
MVGDGLTREVAAIASTPRDPSSHITVQRCTIEHWRRGVYVAGPDSFWTVRDSTITDIGRDGILFDRVSDDGTVPAGEQTGNSALGNTITHTGLNYATTPRRSDDQGTHAIYDNSLNSTVRDNRITDFDTSGISIRYRNSTVQSNLIDGAGRGGIGIGFFSYDRVGGTSTWSHNTIKGLASYRVADQTLPPVGITVAGNDRQLTREDFVIADNTVVMSDPVLERSAKIVIGSLDRAPAGYIQLTRNVASGPSAAELIVEHPLDHQASAIRDNVWWNGGSGPAETWIYGGGVYHSLADFQHASGLGAGDRNTDPKLTG